MISPTLDANIFLPPRQRFIGPSIDPELLKDKRGLSDDDKDTRYDGAAIRDS